MTKPVKARLPLVGAVGFVCVAAVGGIAVAQNSADLVVPEGPEVAFCPTPEQIEAHLDEYGFDYKPTLTCSAEGEVPAQEEPFRDPPQKYSLDEVFEKARTAPDDDGDPASLEYVMPDGQEGEVHLFVAPPAKVTIEDLPLSSGKP